MRPVIDLVYFDATSGHRSAARAIAAAMATQHPEADVRCVNLLDLLEGHPALYRLAQAGIDFFNWGMREEKALFPAGQIALFQRLQRIVPDSAVAAVAGFWRERNPDVVVSLIPICNHFLSRTLRHGKPSCPLLILAVDLDEGLRDYWFDPRADAHYLLASPTLESRCRAAGIPRDRCIVTSGMPIDPSFYADQTGERAAVLASAGLSPKGPTAVVSFGGQGSVFVEECGKQLRKLGPDWNVIFLCGRSERSQKRVAALDTPYRKWVLGFTPEPPARYFWLADVVIGKPGTMTLTEAIVSRRPIVAVTAKSLAVVQRGNERWIAESGVGAVVDLPELSEATRRTYLDTAARTAIERHWHRGVFDISQQVFDLAKRQTHREPHHAA